jgi:hypothetical protein
MLDKKAKLPHFLYSRFRKDGYMKFCSSSFFVFVRGLIFNLPGVQGVQKREEDKHVLLDYRPVARGVIATA